MGSDSTGTMSTTRQCEKKQSVRGVGATVETVENKILKIKKRKRTTGEKNKNKKIKATAR
jgi:hypothetical protein